MRRRQDRVPEAAKLNVAAALRGREPAAAALRQPVNKVGVDGNAGQRADGDELGAFAVLGLAGAEAEITAAPVVDRGGGGGALTAMSAALACPINAMAATSASANFVMVNPNIGVDVTVSCVARWWTNRSQRLAPGNARADVAIAISGDAQTPTGLEAVQ